MRPGLSIHVVDATRDAVADGMRVDVYFLGEHAAKLCTGTVNAAGLVDEPILASNVIVPGEYEVQFHVGEFYRKRGHRLPPIPFLDTVPFRFGIANGEGDCRLSMKIGPSSIAIQGSVGSRMKGSGT